MNQIKSWYEEQLNDGVLSRIYNLDKICNVKKINSNYLYVLYHLGFIEVATLRQLIKLTAFSEDEVRNSIKKLIRYGYIESAPVTFYGNYVKMYSITEKGVSHIENFFCIEIKRSKKSYSTQKHAIEISSLYNNLFSETKQISFEREVKYIINKSDFLRSDAKYKIEYSSGLHESLTLEHDKGTERKNKLLIKLKQYSMAIKNYQFRNISFSISLDHLISNHEANIIAKSEYVIYYNNQKKRILKLEQFFKSYKCKNIKEFVQYVNVLIEKLTLYENNNDGLDQDTYDQLTLDIAEIKDLLFTIIKSESDQSKENINVDELFKELKYKNKKSRDARYLSLLKDYIRKSEQARCDKIKNLILEQEDLVEVTEKERKNVAFEDTFNLFIRKGSKYYVESFKKHLLQHV